MSMFPEPFPERVLSEIREYAGNNKCCDCSSLDTDWGSISHGILICLDCAGKHRSLGVHVSFVRSITMDTWSAEQIEMMRQGGNDQIRRFFKKLEIENSPVQTLYCTKGAAHYRDRLKDRVQRIMRGELKPEPRNRSSSNRSMHGSQSQPNVSKLAASATADSSAYSSRSNSTDHTNGVDSNSYSIGTSGVTHSSSGGSTMPPSLLLPPLSDGAVRESLSVSFGVGAMGMTLTKDCKGMAMVSRLVPGASAQAGGVKVGDVVIGLSKKSVQNYDEIMHMIPCLGRPLLIEFSRVILSNKPQIQHSADVVPISANNTPLTNNRANATVTSASSSVAHNNKHNQSSGSHSGLEHTGAVSHNGIHHSMSDTELSSHHRSQQQQQLQQRKMSPVQSNAATAAAAEGNNIGIAAVTSESTSPEGAATATATSSPRSPKDSTAALPRPKIKIKSKSAASKANKRSPSAQLQHSTAAASGAGSDDEDDEVGAFTSAPKLSVKALRKLKGEHNGATTATTAAAATAVVSSENRLPSSVSSQSSLSSADCAARLPDEQVGDNWENKVDINAAVQSLQRDSDGEIEPSPLRTELREDTEDDAGDDDDDDDNQEEEEDEDGDGDDEEEEDEEQQDEEDGDDEVRDADAPDDSQPEVNTPTSPASPAPATADSNITAAAATAPTDVSSSQPRKFVLEAGAVVKVLRDGRWRSAVIRRRHKDGTFKVTYRDTTSEAHVPIARMAIEKKPEKEESVTTASSEQQQQQQSVVDEQAAIADDDIFEAAAVTTAPQQQQLRQQQKDPYLEYLNDQLQATSMQSNQSDEFVVDADVDLNNWIDNEIDEDIQQLNSRAVQQQQISVSQVPRNKGKKKQQKVVRKPAGGDAYEEIDDGCDDNDVDDIDVAAAAAQDGTTINGLVEFMVEFDEPPLNLTLSTASTFGSSHSSSSAASQPVVTRTVPGGKADSLGVQVGDVLSMIDFRPVSDYAVAMQILPSCAYPLRLHFRRGEEKSFLQQSGELMLQGSKALAQTLVSTIQGKRASILDVKPKSGLSDQFVSSSSSTAAATAASSSTSSASQQPLSRFLDKQPAEGEFDVVFHEADLGFKIDERFGFNVVSVVTAVADDGAAKQRSGGDVRVGCVVLGVNYERYISHAHTVATMLHAKRPITVRFQKYQR